jgi:hypothetical protein
VEYFASFSASVQQESRLGTELAVVVWVGIIISSTVTGKSGSPNAQLSADYILANTVGQY